MSIKDNWLRQGHIKTSMWCCAVCGPWMPCADRFCLDIIFLSFSSYFFIYLFIERLYRNEWQRFSIDLILTIVISLFHLHFSIQSFFSPSIRIQIHSSSWGWSIQVLMSSKSMNHAKRSSFLIDNKMETLLLLLWQQFSIWRLMGIEWSTVESMINCVDVLLTLDADVKSINRLLVVFIDCLLFRTRRTMRWWLCSRRLRWTRMVVVFEILTEHRPHDKWI